MKQQAEDLELQAKALELARAGATTRDIASQLGIGKGTVHRVFKRAGKHLVGEPMRDWLAELTVKCERMLAGLEEHGANDGDAKAVLAAVKLLERIARMHGVDAPTKVDMTRGLKDMSDAELAELERRLSGKGAA